MISGFSKRFQIFISLTRAESQDSIFLEQSKTSYFYQSLNNDFSLNRFDKSKGDLVTYEFQPAQENQVYQRYAYTMFDALGQLGGVQSSLMLIGFVFTALFSYRLMMSSLIGKLFYFRPRWAAEVKKKKKAKKEPVKMRKGH